MCSVRKRKVTRRKKGFRIEHTVRRIEKNNMYTSTCVDDHDLYVYVKRMSVPYFRRGEMVGLVVVGATFQLKWRFIGGVVEGVGLLVMGGDGASGGDPLPGTNPQITTTSDEKRIQ